MSAEQNIEAARQMDGTFGRGDVQAILDRVTDDIDWSTDAAIPSGGYWTWSLPACRRTAGPRWTADRRDARYRAGTRHAGAGRRDRLVGGDRIEAGAWREVAGNQA
jgi:hypothetical protein